MKARDLAVPIVIIAMLLGAYFAYRYWSSRSVESGVAVDADSMPTTPSTEPAEDAPKAPHYPIPDAHQAAQPALPELAASDAGLHDALIEVFQAEPVDAFLVPKDIVRRFVAMIDGLTEPSLPMRSRPIRKIDGKFAVQASDQGIAVSPVNSARYAGFVEALQLADTGLCVRLYFRYYPLFQAAYEELGHSTYFNDRLVAVIDHLLATPDAQGPLLLVQPKVFYEFADPALQTRSAGQKALLRVGPENADIIKGKLRELRAAIVGFNAQTPSP